MRDYRQRIERAGRDVVNELRGAVRERQQRIDEAGLHAKHAMQVKQQETRNRLTQLTGQLRLLGPEAVLERGYSITRAPDGAIIRDAAPLSKGMRLTTLLAKGRIESTIENTHTEDERDD